MKLGIGAWDVVRKTLSDSGLVADWFATSRKAGPFIRDISFCGVPENGSNASMVDVKDVKIVLNVSMNATQRLQLLNHGIEFDARFAGVVHHVRVPISAVLGIYARETGEGMVFNEGEPEAPPPADAGAPAVPARGEMRRPKLTVVK